MLSKVRVLPEDEFKRWYFSDEVAPKPAAAAPAAGEAPAVALLRSKACLACHSLDGTPMVGPTFKGLFGARQSVLFKGEKREVAVDEDFLRQVIAKPESAVVVGYPPVMPPAPLSAAEIKEMVAYLKSLRGR
jgi:cytochrome c oxidase subunit 2